MPAIKKHYGWKGIESNKELLCLFCMRLSSSYAANVKTSDCIGRVIELMQKKRGSTSVIARFLPLSISLCGLMERGIAKGAVTCTG
jgi:hypothetical protein